MAEILLITGTAFWLGILTSISPCPLATNIAAISYIGRRVGSPAQVLWTGVLYTAGRALTYTTIGVVLVLSLLSAPYVSHVLQKDMNKFLGPILILVAMFLLDLIRLDFAGTGIRGLGEQLQGRAENWGVWGGALLGVVFSLSFCPVSAALFFGSLLPLAVQHQSGVLLPSLFGVGTALPVVVFAVLLAFGARSVSRVFRDTTRVEVWARRVTGVVFLGVGIYYSLVYIFGVI